MLNQTLATLQDAVGGVDLAPQEPRQGQQRGLAQGKEAVARAELDKPHALGGLPGPQAADTAGASFVRTEPFSKAPPI